MKLPKACKIELAASVDPKRKILTEPYLAINEKLGLDAADTVRSAEIVSTDGTIMAIVPVEIDEQDTAGLVNPEAIKAARKAAGKLDTKLGVNGSATIPNGVTMPRSQMSDNGVVDYPNYKAVIPNGSAHTFKIALDASLLWRLAQALGSEGPVVLSFNPKGKPGFKEGTFEPDVIMVSWAGAGTPTGGKGVIAPMRMN